MLPGVPCRFTAGLTILIGPWDGCSKVVTISFAAICGSAASSPYSCTTSTIMSCRRSSSTHSRAGLAANSSSSLAIRPIRSVACVRIQSMLSSSGSSRVPVASSIAFRKTGQ